MWAWEPPPDQLERVGDEHVRDGGSLIGQDGASLNGGDGGKLVMLGLIGQDGASIVTAGGGNIVAGGGGNLWSTLSSSVACPRS